MPDSLTKKINDKIKRIHSSMPIQDIHTIPGFSTIMEQHPKPDVLNGYFVRLKLSEIDTYVPDVQTFDDRYGEPYREGERFDAPLLTLSEWRQAVTRKGHPTPSLMANANWFHIWKPGAPANPGDEWRLDLRKEPRTHLVGLSMHKDKVVSSHTIKDDGNISLDTILFNQHDQIASVTKSLYIEPMLAKWQGKQVNAVSGFSILNQSKSTSVPPTFRNNSHVARTAIGLNKQTNEIVVMVITDYSKDSGATIPELVNLLRACGCTEALNLDGSGSSCMLYEGADQFGCNTKLETITSDKEMDQSSPNYGKPVDERPKPNFIGFRITSKPKQYAYEEADAAPRTAKVNSSTQDDIRLRM